MSRKLLLAVVLSVAAAGPAAAQTVVVPATLPETGGVSTIIRQLPRTYMSYYTDDNFTALTQPVSITGFRLRLAAGVQPATIGASWPSQPLTLNNFNVQLSQASVGLNTDGEFLSATQTFASYQVNPVTTRTGPLTIATGAYANTAATGGANAFGPTIEFSTPYTYTPGNDLLFYATHDGYNPSAEPQPFFASASFQNGVADAISSTVGYQASASNGFTDPYIIEFVFVPVPEPTGLLAAGLVGLTAVRYARRRTARVGWIS